MRELGLAGVQIGTHVNGVNLGDPRLFEFFEAAQELGAAVFVHPWDMLGGERMAKYWLPWLVGMPTETTLAICSVIFGGVLERLPRLRIAFAHGGGSFPGTVGRIQHGFESRPDLVATHSQVAPREYLRKGDEPGASSSTRSCTIPTRCATCSTCSARSASRSAPTTRSRSASTSPAR